MQNKRVCLALKPTKEKDIFLLTAGQNTDDSGYSIENNFGSILPIPHEIEGTNGEKFYGDLVELTTYGASIVHFNTLYMRFSTGHQPDKNPTEVYIHLKDLDGSIKSMSCYFNRGENWGEDPKCELDFYDYIDKTIRIYLGPSETPPPYL